MSAHCLACDNIITMKIVQNKTYTNLIKNMWKHALRKHRDIPVNWINDREVLVGSGR